jgi:anti-sigma regulatory factor (Ser/Thr protein kinase)
LDRDHGSAYPLHSRPSDASLLSELPVLPGLHVDARYIMSGAGDPAGCAWFDVIALADGRAAMLVGDAVQHGTPAASVTRHVRAVLAPLLVLDGDLVAALEQLRRTMDGAEAAYATTVCAAIVDPIEGDVRYSTCGSSAPLIVATGGRTRMLRTTGGAALGEGQSLSPIAVETARLDRDEVLVLHSDGLTSESCRVVAAELDGHLGKATATADCGAGPAQDEPKVMTEEVCRTTAGEMRRTGTRDIAVLAVQHRPKVAGFQLKVPAVAASMESVGEAVGDWLAGLRSSVEDGAGMVLAVREAMANAIQHAFVGARIGSVTVEATLLTDGVLACSVRDDGRWLPPIPSASGHSRRGMRLMARVADRMMVRREHSGTVVELRRRLHHPVSRVLTASETS